jgi:hypothetical protein
MALGDQINGVRARMKAAREKPDACKGVAGFTEADWWHLDTIRPIDDDSTAKPPSASR